MTGFIRGLFGGKKADRPNGPTQAKGAFYLDADDAKSYGDIDYMRTSKTVKRTFARKKGQTKEVESIKQVSALGSTPYNNSGTFPSVGTSTGSSTGSTGSTSSSGISTQNNNVANSQSKRRKPDSSMDTFRNMAREMRK
ncbi:hypothetical protein IQ241_06915 [Romeria aff. gracilis LEGE 07310]|uniref:Uncharacterized protein n=1 Tax=Vasconcelosia minhoensis LEGE 07310 TaxID=915328 RepID=A0A8J7DQS1_9CYAN|nr:hypothetical protein [Romeria gracilis]MBE9077029.1 hypothetical protein [Romeria aff. gracilis LEGE 07310]